MFSRSKDGDAPQPPQAAPKRNQGRAAPSIISTDLTFTGTVISAGDIQVDGKIEGDIRTTSMTVGEKAHIQGEIIAEDVVVRGRVTGTIRARKVQLASTCHVEGTILHEALSVEAGAFFEGHCRHSADPLGEVVLPAPAPETRRPAPAQPPAPAIPPPQAAVPPAPQPVIVKPIAPVTVPKPANGLYPK